MSLTRKDKPTDATSPDETVTSDGAGTAETLEEREAALTAREKAADDRDADHDAFLRVGRNQDDKPGTPAKVLDDARVREPKDTAAPIEWPDGQRDALTGHLIDA